MGLIFCAVIGMLQSSLLGVTGTEIIGVIGDVLYAVSVLLFAIGFSREASVVGRKPLGMAAMAAVAIWPLFAFMIARSLPPQTPTDDSTMAIYGYLSLLIPAAAGLIAAAQIARNDNVPFPWRWAPLWVLGLYAFAWAIPQIIFATVRAEGVQAFADLLMMLGTIASLAGTLGLGVLSIVLAAQQRPDSVEVYRSA